MRNRATNSARPLAESERQYGSIAKLQSDVKRLACAASNLLSSRSLLGEFLVVVVVSIILLRTSG